MLISLSLSLCLQNNKYFVDQLQSVRNTHSWVDTYKNIYRSQYTAEFHWRELKVLYSTASYFCLHFLPGISALHFLPLVWSFLDCGSTLNSLNIPFTWYSYVPCMYIIHSWVCIWYIYYKLHKPINKAEWDIHLGGGDSINRNKKMVPE